MFADVRQIWSTRPLGGQGPFAGRAGHGARFGVGRATALQCLETGAVLFILLMLSSALVGRLGNPDGVGEPPAWLRQMWLPIYGGVIILAATQLGRLPSVWLGALTVAPILGWTLASSQWSLQPDVSSRRALAVIFPTLFALYLAARYDWRGLIRIIAITSLVLAVGSFIAAVATPKFGVHQDLHAGAWKGMFFEKNALGGTMVRGALACLCVMTFTGPKERMIWLGAALLCGLLVVKSTSTTALLGLVIVFAAVVGLAFLRRGPLFAVGGLWLGVAAVLAIGAVFAADPQIFFDLVGKDATLTGRTNIWAAIMRQVAHQPLTGYGYGAFWGYPNGPAAWVVKEADWHVLAADNAWAEILVQLGWVGVGLYSLTVLIPAPAALLSPFKRAPAAYWALPFFTVLLLNSITESILLKQNDLTWVLQAATLAKLLQRDEPPDGARL